MLEKTTLEILEETNKLLKVGTLAVNDKGQTALHLAVNDNNMAVAALLLAKGYNPNQKDNNQLSPFIAAAANGLDGMFDLLLVYKPNLYEVNRFGGTALLPSSEKGFIKIVQSAIDAGVPINHQNRLGWTALQEAVILGNDGFLYRDIVEELITHEADIYVKDFENLSALDCAQKREKRFILSILTNTALITPFKKVKKLIREKKYYDSLKLLLDMEESTEQYYYLGFIYESLNDYDSAFYYYGKGYELDNQFAYYLANLAKKMGKSALTIQYLKKGQEVSQDEVFFKYHLSNYLRELGHHKKAIAIMDELLLIDLNRADYLFHKANSLKSLARYKDAYETLQVATKIQPKNPLFEEYAEEILQLI